MTYRLLMGMEVAPREENTISLDSLLFKTTSIRAIATYIWGHSAIVQLQQQMYILKFSMSLNCLFREERRLLQGTCQFISSVYEPS